MFSKLTQQIVLGMIRHGLTIAGGALVANGYATSSQEQQIIGGILAAATVAWSAWQKRNVDAKLKATKN